MTVQALVRLLNRKPSGFAPVTMGAYNPALSTLKIRDAINLGARFIYTHAGNQVSKTVGTSSILAAWLCDYKAWWVPEKPTHWKAGPALRIIAISTTLKNSDKDFWDKFLPFIDPSRVARRFVDVNGRVRHVKNELEFLDGSYVVCVPWTSMGVVQARRVLQGYTVHVVFAVEEVPPPIWEEAQQRVKSFGGIMIQAAAMGLEAHLPHARVLDTSYFQVLAQTAEHCGDPECRHTGIVSGDCPLCTDANCTHIGKPHPARACIWIPYDFAHVRNWQRPAEVEEAIRNTHMAERAVRVYGRWGKHPTGRAFPSYADADHLRRFTLRDVQEAVGMDVVQASQEVALVVDMGGTDDMFTAVMAHFKEPCRACGSSKTPGYLPCIHCRGRGRVGRLSCTVCTEKPGRQECRTCDARGWMPFIAYLAEYQTEPGKNTTAENCQGIRGAMIRAQLTLSSSPHSADPSWIEAFIVDNMTGGKEAKSAYNPAALRSEAEKLGSAEYLGLSVKHTPAIKYVSPRLCYERHDALFARRERRMVDGEMVDSPSCWVHPDCTRLRKVFNNWTYLTEHGGPHGDSHADAVARYTCNYVFVGQLKGSTGTF